MYVLHIKYDVTQLKTMNKLRITFFFTKDLILMVSRREFDDI